MASMSPMAALLSGGRTGADRPPPEASLRRVLAWCALPVVLSASCGMIAFVLPDGSVSAQMLQAVLLAGVRWLLLLSVLWSLRVGLRFRRWRLPGLVAVFSFVLAGVPVFGAGAKAPGGQEGLRLLFGNVNAYTDPPAPERLAAAIVALDPDIVILAERRLVEVPGLSRVADNLDVKVARPSHHTMVFCRDGIGCEATLTEEFGSPTSVMPVALLRVKPSAQADPICVIGLHSPPPAPLDATGIIPHIRQIAAAIEDGRMVRDWGPCQVGDGVLATGDLNHVPGGRPYRMLAARGLRDLFLWRGVWAVSWPAGGGWPNMPFFQLDQAMAGRVRVDGLRRLRLPGADHKAMIMRLY